MLKRLLFVFLLLVFFNNPGYGMRVGNLEVMGDAVFNGNVKSSGTIILNTSREIMNCTNTHWDAAYSWGDHSTQNYFDKDVDKVGDSLIDYNDVTLDDFITLSPAQIIIGNSGGVASPVTVSGVVAISDSGVTSIGANQITDTMVKDDITISGDGSVDAGAIKSGNLDVARMPLHGTWNFGGDGIAGVINVMSDAGDTTIVIDGMQNRIETGSIKIGANYSISSAGLVANDKIADSDKWDGHQFDDYLDQAVKTSSAPTFQDVILSSSDPTIKTDTSSGSDNKRVVIVSSGSISQSRGAHLEVRGNQYGSAGERGLVQLIAGTISSPTGNDGSIILTTNGSGRVYVKQSGEVVMPAVYTNTVGGTNRDLFIDDTGKLGYVSSSRRYKTHIRPLSDASWIYNLKPKIFDRKASPTDDSIINKDEYGLIAEEVCKVNPRIVSFQRKVRYADDDTSHTHPIYYTSTIPQTVDYGSPYFITALLVEIQNNHKKIETLQSEVDAMRAEITQMQADILDLKSQINSK